MGPGSGPVATQLRRLGVALALLAVVLAPLVARVWIDGRAELREANLAADAGEPERELLHLGRAARHRLPLAGHDEEARARLAALGEASAAAADPVLALAAWRELRGALLGTRTLAVVDPEQLALANAAIVEQMTAQAEAEGRPVARERWAAELDEDIGGRGRSLLAAACFVAWLVCALGLFVFGVDAKGRLRPRPALRLGAGVLVSLLAWIALM